MTRWSLFLQTLSLLHHFLGLTSIDAEALHQEVQIKYAEVALSPTKGFHFHTGRPLAERLGYLEETLDALPEE